MERLYSLVQFLVGSQNWNHLFLQVNLAASQHLRGQIIRLYIRCENTRLGKPMYQMASMKQGENETHCVLVKFSGNFKCEYRYNLQYCIWARYICMESDLDWTRLQKRFFSVYIGNCHDYHGEKMAACTFYQNVLRAYKVNDWIKMIRNLQIIRNSILHNEDINLLPYACISRRIFRRFPAAKHFGKMYIRHLFINIAC